MAAARRAFFCGNWKLNGSIAESLALATDVRNGVATLRDVDVAVGPSFTALYAVAKRLEDGPVAVAAQDCFWEEKGAFTGEVSPAQLADAGCKHVILGHSERRQYHGETDALVAQKAKAAWAAGLNVIICVGESDAERREGQAHSVCHGQINASVPTAASAANTAIAYEPVWAIGTGKTPTANDIEGMHAHLRRCLSELLGEGAKGIRILYGGSVNPANAAEILNLAGVDGALVGGASLKAMDFLKIIAAVRAS